MQTCAGGVTLCGGTVGGRGSGSKARFTAEKSVERRAIVDSTLWSKRGNATPV